MYKIEVRSDSNNSLQASFAYDVAVEYIKQIINDEFWSLAELFKGVRS